MSNSPDERNAATALALLAAHEEHPSTVKATKAREQFFPLLEAVVRDPHCVVYVEHKDLPGRGILVGEGYRQYVRELEATVRALLGPAPGVRFTLAGSLSLGADASDGLADVERELAALRADQAERAAARFDDV